MSDCRKCAKFEECAVDEDCGLFVEKPMTNADRIRAMTDEELADFLLHICDWNWLDWLKAPVEEVQK